MKFSEIKRKLKKEGCYPKREGARHTIWYSPKTGNSFPLSRHDKEEVNIKTLKAIVKQSGINL